MTTTACHALIDQLPMEIVDAAHRRTSNWTMTSPSRRPARAAGPSMAMETTSTLAAAAAGRPGECTRDRRLLPATPM